MPRSSCGNCEAGINHRFARDGLLARYLAGALIASASLLGGQSARADCTPQAAGQSNLIATCTGTTTNQGGGAPGTSAGAHGYGTGAENATVTVEGGASLTGTGANARGIYLGQGTVINKSGAVIAGNQSGIATAGTNALSVMNSGNIQGAGFGIDGLGLTTITNNVGAVITGTAYGVSGGTLILENYGSITGFNYGGAAGFLASTITNYAGGTITGSSYGVTVNQAGLVNNYGTISGVGPFVQAAIGVGANSIINNAAGGVITSSAQAAIRIGADSAVYNSGTISGLGYGIHSNPGAGGVRVYNAGSISATLIDGNTGAIDAILFEGTGNKLTIAPGSSISGAAIGTGSDAFELGGSGAATFDVSQLSPTGKYRGFGTFIKANS